jgi:hypothetical protein
MRDDDTFTARLPNGERVTLRTPADTLRAFPQPEHFQRGFLAHGGRGDGQGRRR